MLWANVKEMILLIVKSVHWRVIVPSFKSDEKASNYRILSIINIALIFIGIMPQSFSQFCVFFLKKLHFLGFK